MIQANELRIGNWVINSHNEYQQVFKIRDDSMRIHKISSTVINCSAIPLTPEILEKCGFDNFEDGWYGKNKFRDGYTFTWNIYDKILRYNGLDTHCKYLHQLQNLYFALTGEELNINL